MTYRQNVFSIPTLSSLLPKLTHHTKDNHFNNNALTCSNKDILLNEYNRLYCFMDYYKNLTNVMDETDPRYIQCRKRYSDIGRQLSMTVSMLNIIDEYNVKITHE